MHYDFGYTVSEDSIASAFQLIKHFSDEAEEEVEAMMRNRGYTQRDVAAKRNFARGLRKASDILEVTMVRP